MKYYRVKPEFDNKRRFKFHRGGGLEAAGVYIGNELYTPTEIKKYLGYAQYCEVVDIPKNKVYFSFGARFEKKKEGIIKCTV